jgi:hypothetical protein
MWLCRLAHESNGVRPQTHIQSYLLCNLIQCVSVSVDMLLDHLFHAIQSISASTSSPRYPITRSCRSANLHQHRNTMYQTLLSASPLYLHTQTVLIVCFSSIATNRVYAFNVGLKESLFEFGWKRRRVF